MSNKIRKATPKSQGSEDEQPILSSVAKDLTLLSDFLQTWLFFLSLAVSQFNSLLMEHCNKKQKIIYVKNTHVKV